MIFDLKYFPDPVLREKCIDVPLNTDISSLIRDMKETMNFHNGLGLAAPQIGLSLNLFVTRDMGVFINPVITNLLQPVFNVEESCLSIPDTVVTMKRHFQIGIKYYDENWVEKVSGFEGMQAVCIQHEYDHLLGKLIID